MSQNKAQALKPEEAGRLSLTNRRIRYNVTQQQGKMASTIKSSLPQPSTEAQNWGKGHFKSGNYTVKGEGDKRAGKFQDVLIMPIPSPIIPRCSGYDRRGCNR